MGCMWRQTAIPTLFDYTDIFNLRPIKITPRDLVWGGHLIGFPGATADEASRIDEDE